MGRGRKLSDESFAALFWSRTKRMESGCIEWTGTIQRYGVIHIDGKSQRAHRIAWEITNGPIPAGLLVCHHCDNPPCVNPEHLFTGTASDNAHDCIAKGRRVLGGPIPVCCPKGHPLAGDNVTKDAIGRVLCVTCLRIKSDAKRKPDPPVELVRQLREHGSTMSAIASIVGAHEGRVSKVLHADGLARLPSTAEGRTPRFSETSHNSRKTMCAGGHELAGSNLRVTPAGFRACRACERERGHSRDRKSAQPVGRPRTGPREDPGMIAERRKAACARYEARKTAMSTVRRADK